MSDAFGRWSVDGWLVGRSIEVTEEISANTKDRVMRSVDGRSMVGRSIKVTERISANTRECAIDSVDGAYYMTQSGYRTVDCLQVLELGGWLGV